MGLGRSRGSFAGFARALAVLAIGSLAGGCFQPIYGSRTATGEPVVREALRGVEVIPISVPPNSAEAPLAVQIRNELLFSMRGGDTGLPPSHRLRIQLVGTSNTVAADGNTGFTQIENYTLRASYVLTEIATGRTVVTGQTVAATGYDGAGQQRFARLSAGGDAGRRTAKVISEQIATRLAAYFVSGA